MSDEFRPDTLGVRAGGLRSDFQEHSEALVLTASFVFASAGRPPAGSRARSPVALQLLFTYVPAMNRLFGSAPIGWDVWGVIVVFGLFVFVVIEIEKRFRGHVLEGEPRKPE